MSLIDLLYDSALQYDSLWNEALDEATDVENLAVHHVFAQQARSDLDKYFNLYMELPYDSTKSLEAVLCFLAARQLPNSWKAAQIKMGLFLANDIGRLAWYILHSSLLYTFETLVKFRKERGRTGYRLCNLFYVDLPSASSSANNSSWQVICNLKFRDDPWVDVDDFSVLQERYKDHDFWLGVLSYPGRRYTADEQPNYNQLLTIF
jgi:hypothetical protein